MPEEARFKNLLGLPEGSNIGHAINHALKAIEQENRDLQGVLPRTYNRLENDTLVELLKLMASLPATILEVALGKTGESSPGTTAWIWRG